LKNFLQKKYLTSSFSIHTKFLSKSFFYHNYKNDTKTYNSFEYINYKIFIQHKFYKLHKTFSPNLKSLVQFKNKSNTDLLLNSLMTHGKKLQFLKAVNYVNSIFYYSFFFKNSLLTQKFDNYVLFLNFSKFNEFFFDFNFILSNIITLNESVFNLKVIKLNKKSKKKLKKNFDFEIKYLKKNKRALNVLKTLHLVSNSYNYYNYYERLLASFFTTFLLQKTSQIYKKKIYTYSTILKKKFK
jgi:hypothetical protein